MRRVLNAGFCNRCSKIACCEQIQSLRRMLPGSYLDRHVGVVHRRICGFGTISSYALVSRLRSKVFLLSESSSFFSSLTDVFFSGFLIFLLIVTVISWSTLESVFRTYDKAWYWKLLIFDLYPERNRSAYICGCRTRME